MREAIEAYIRRVKDLSEHVRGNEQATKKSLVEPLFTALGYDVTDPRECVPEHREDFGRNRSVKPVDYAFFQNGKPIFFVEAKEVNRRLVGYDEQLGDYFAKAPDAKLGILTNGLHWRFFADVDNENVMDKRPFLEWQVLSDAAPPWDFLKLLQKAQHNAELIRTFAQRQRQQNLLVEELTRLLEPAPEFVRLALANIETRNLTASVVESWRPVLRAAIHEWAKQQRLSSILQSSSHESDGSTQDSEPRVDTTKEELEGFAAVQKILGQDRPVAFEDTASYFKIHLPERDTWVICRLVNFHKKRPAVWVPVSPDRVKQLSSEVDVTAPVQGWSAIPLSDHMRMDAIAELLRTLWDEERARHPVSAPTLP